MPQSPPEMNETPPVDSPVGDREPMEPEPAPTDFRRNAWMLVIIVSVVVAAWAASILGGRPEVPSQNDASAIGPETSAGPRQQEQQRSLSRPNTTRPAQPVGPSYAPAEIMVDPGSGRSFIWAEPPRRLPSGMPYRRPRVFDVTQKAEGFRAELLWRDGVQGERYADQITTIPLYDLTQTQLERVVRTTSEHEPDVLPEADRLLVIRTETQLLAVPEFVLQGYPFILTGDDEKVLCIWHFAMQTASALTVEVKDGAPAVGDAALLYRGAHVIYDDSTRSLWDGYSGKALTGPSAGKELPVARATVLDVMTWAEYRQAHPDGRVYIPESVGSRISEPTQPPQIVHMDTTPFKLESYQPWRKDAYVLPPMAFVLGVRAGDTARAYPLAKLLAAGETEFEDTIGSQKIRVRVTTDMVGHADGVDRAVEDKVMLWYAWKDRNPDTEVSDRGSSPDGGGTPGQQ